jgi:hypothetical protein
MPPFNKKGFYATTPLVGTLIFVIAAAIAILFTTENTTQIDLATSSDAHGKMIFVGEAILADSFTNLMQKEVEKIVVDFISGDEPVNINPGKSWENNLRDVLVNRIKTDMDEDMEGILEAYSDAYTGLPGHVRCRTENTESSKMLPSFDEIPDGDGTIWVRAFTFGKNINCTSEDPPSTTIVNFWDREYMINVRIINLFKAAVAVIDMAIDAIDNPNMAKATNGEVYIRGEMSSSKWKNVEEGNNKIVKEDSDNQMQLLIDDWFEKVKFLKQRITNILPAEQTIFADFILGGFSAGFDESKGIDAFRVSCLQTGDSHTRSCASKYFSLLLGNKACSDTSWQVYLPLHLHDPFFRIVEFSARYYIENEAGSTRKMGIQYSRQVDLLMRSIFSNLGYACVNMDETVKYGAYGVCKEWAGVPEEIKFNGSIIDSNPEFNPTTSDSIGFNFVSTYSPLGYAGEGLECTDLETGRNEMSTYLTNLFSILEVKIGYTAQVGKWKDLGSSLVETKADSGDTWILDMFRDTAKGAPLPLVEFNGDAPSYIKPAHESQYYGNERIVKTSIDWSSFTEACKNTRFINDLCTTVCESNPKSIASNIANFCGSIAETGTTGSSGMLQCKCSGGDRYLSMSVDRLILSA